MGNYIEALVLPLFILGFVALSIALILFFVRRGQTKKNNNSNNNNGANNISSNKAENLKDKVMNMNKGKKKSNIDKKDPNIKKEDVFKFMEFDKITDDMIVQDKGRKFTMAIKCKGINYDLMSDIEQLGIEEGFITFLNTLKFPVQLYVQAQNIDLKKSIDTYNERLKGLREEYDDSNDKYNRLLNSLETSDEELGEAEVERTSIRNVLEYASDIVKYVERLSLNKSLLQRNFYVLVSYYSSEITSTSNFSKEEISNICYNELYTRVQTIISALATCSVSAKPLESNELAELLYTSYNRDDKNYVSVEQALESGFYRLYSTSKDAFERRREMLDKNIAETARLKAIEALKKAIDEGEYISQEELEDDQDQEIGKQAIDIIKAQNVNENVKDKAKKIIVEEYKTEKRKRIKAVQERTQRAQEQLTADEKDDNGQDNNTDETKSTNAADDSIV